MKLVIYYNSILTYLIDIDIELRYLFVAFRYHIEYQTKYTYQLRKFELCNKALISIEFVLMIPTTTKIYPYYLIEFLLKMMMFPVIVIVIVVVMIIVKRISIVNILKG